MKKTIHDEECCQTRNEPCGCPLVDVCPECESYKDFEAHFDGTQTWIMCNCGFEGLYSDGDKVEEATRRFYEYKNL